MNGTILVVDDNSVERSVFTSFLKSDYTIIEAINGNEALEIIHKQYADISAIVLDVSIPGMTCFEILKIIKDSSIWHTIPVIVTIKNEDDEDLREKAISYGADNFIRKPYNSSLLRHVIMNVVKLKEMSSISNAIWRDRLTQLINPDAFFAEIERMINRHEPGYYVLSCFNIDNFKVINDQYGKTVGDFVLKHVAKSINELIMEKGGLACRYMGDLFAILYPSSIKNSVELISNHQLTMKPDGIVGSIHIRIGRYIVNDKSIPVNNMFDRALLAENTIKNRFDSYIATYTDDMRDSLIAEQNIVNSMNKALENGEFVPYFQPQYNHATGALIGAEALVRWKKGDKFISPAEFVPVFERNGFIYEMDKYIWEQVCILLRRWLDEGKKPLPVSVNISRRDVFHKQFITVITGLVKQYDISFDLLRLEITESAMTDSSVIDKVGELIKLGFTIEVDDFGSGYSSLNTLKDVPASILKLDMRFFEKSENTDRGGNIIESVVRMAKWLGMAVIAEGVEEKAQADYLKSIGCYYIQGFFYAKPMPISDYEKLLDCQNCEPKLSRLQTIETLDSNLFWDPNSMETLIFNSYVGGACIFEFYKNRSELLRINDQYISEFKGLIPEGTELKNCDIDQFLDKDNKEILKNMLRKADQDNKEASCEVTLSDGKQTEYIRYIARVIARTSERVLYYAVIVNETEFRESERKQKESAERLSIIMENVNGGVSALQIFDDGTSNVVFHNDKYYELFGYTHEEAERLLFDPMSCILPESFPLVMEKIKKLKEDGIPVIIDYAILKSDGSVAYIRANCALMEMAGFGKVIASVLVDVTEKRTMEDQLRAIVDNINGGVTAIRMKEDKMEFLLINDNYYEFIGYTKEQFESEVNDAFALIHPDDRDRIRNLFFVSKETESSYTMEYRICRRNGAIRYVLCNTSIIHLFGIKELIQLSVINDITELREAQQKELNLSVQMSTIMKNIRGGITATVFHDEKDLEIIFSNDGFYELFGYSKEQLNGDKLNILDLVLPEDREKAIKMITRIVHERGSETFEYRCRKRDGSVMWIQITNAIISMKGISDTVILSIITDITGLRRAEEENREWSDRLKAVMNAMTSGMTAMIADGHHVRLLFSNEKYYQLHGINNQDSGEDLLHTIIQTIHPDDRDRVRHIVLNTTDIGQSAEGEYRVCLPDGSIRYVKAVLSVTNLFGIDEPVQVTIYSDITVEKEADNQLRFLNESAHDIITEPDSDKALDVTIKKMASYFNADRGYIIEIDANQMQTSNTYEFCADGIESKKECLQKIPYDTTDFWYKTLLHNHYFAIPNVSELGDDEQELREMLTSQGIQSIIVAPLIRDGSLIGFIGVDNPHESIERMSQLTALADYISILLNRRDMMKKIEHDAKNVQQLMDDTPGGFLRLELFENKDPVIVNVNSGFCKMLSMTHDEIIEKYEHNVYSCLAPEDAIAAAGEILVAYKLGEQYTSQCRLLKKTVSISVLCYSADLFMMKMVVYF